MLNMEKKITAHIYIGEGKALINKRLIFYQEKISTFAEFIRALYKQEQVTYPRFYKMDSLSKLGFLAAELLFRQVSPGRFKPGRIAVVLSNSSSSLDTDLSHQESIRDRTAYFPSPSVFVYTLANIVIGEICIRHGIKGENAFLISEKFNPELLTDFVDEIFENDRADACLCGWIELLGNSFRAVAVLVEKSGENDGTESSGSALDFSADSLAGLIKENE